MQTIYLPRTYAHLYMMCLIDQKCKVSHRKKKGPALLVRSRLGKNRGTSCSSAREYVIVNYFQAICGHMRPWCIPDKVWWRTTWQGLVTDKNLIDRVMHSFSEWISCWIDFYIYHIVSTFPKSTDILGVLSGWCPSSLAKLVHITSISIVYGWYHLVI